MNERIPVIVYSADPVLEAGITAQLQASPEVWVVRKSEIDSARVALVAADEIDEDTLRSIKAIQRNGCPRVVLVVTHADDVGLLASVEAGACGLLKRSEATSTSMGRAIRAASAGDGTLPPDLLGRLLQQVGRLHRQVLEPRGLKLNGLSNREIEVLKLVADGMSTAEIADQLAYSERTIKNVMQGITTRLQLRNRSHAVAYALREGLI